MKYLENTLYVTNPQIYISLDGENVVLTSKGTEVHRMPLHNIESIVIFGYLGISPALMGACNQKGISINFLTMNGRFLARVCSENKGNVLLRKTQYRVSDDIIGSLEISRMFILGKVSNSRRVIERTLRDYPLRVNKEKFKNASCVLKSNVTSIQTAQNLEELRGFEGESASIYFSVFNDMILSQKENFSFYGRKRRPPTDNVNAMLSFLYSLLANECTSALSSVGLDPYVGFLHRDRPGRISLSLDLMEELRSIMVDRFVITLINTKQINGGDFFKKESGAVVMNDCSRRNLISLWQKKKQEVITHPFLKEKIQWGLVPHVQALLLARFLRGDLDVYPPFFWK